MGVFTGSADSLSRASLIDLYRQRGGLAYEGEGITQLQHAWQGGRLALAAGASPELQLAVWLHDVGHLLSDLQGTPTLAGIDDTHEVAGGRVLTRLFGEAVGTPVALHVAAKRYLVTRQPGYLAKLSPDSTRSLALQGGPMSDEDCGRFEQSRHARDALRLRAWDEASKVEGMRPDSTNSALAELKALMDAVPQPPLPANL